jgi:hypothetical protein
MRRLVEKSLVLLKKLAPVAAFCYRLGYLIRKTLIKERMMLGTCLKSHGLSIMAVRLSVCAVIRVTALHKQATTCITLVFRDKVH